MSPLGNSNSTHWKKEAEDQEGGKELIINRGRLPSLLTQNLPQRHRQPTHLFVVLQRQYRHLAQPA